MAIILAIIGVICFGVGIYLIANSIGKDKSE